MNTNTLTAATVHSPSHFEPADYEVLDYLDNKRPAYMGGPVEAYDLCVRDWEADLARTLGPDWRSTYHRCIHCGNGNVRWITAVRHLPTQDVVVFGADCTHRLGFANRVAWKLAQLQSRAAAGHARLKVWNARVAFLAANPTLAAAIEQAKGEAHQRNSFVQDVLAKLDRFGSLSQAQVAAVLTSLARDVDYAARKAAEATEVKGPAPSGRVTVTGEVLSVKDYESAYGTTSKMLVKLTTNARVFCTVPGGVDVERGQHITVTATWTPKTDDLTFAFGKRPIVHEAA